MQNELTPLGQAVSQMPGIKAAINEDQRTGETRIDALRIDGIGTLAWRCPTAGESPETHRHRIALRDRIEWLQGVVESVTGVVASMSTERPVAA